MPVVFDFKCPECDGRYESLLKSWQSPNPECPTCHKPTERLPAAPKSVWTKAYGEYGDPKKEYYNPEGVWAYRTKTTRHADGTPERVLLRTRQEAKTFAHDEGLYMPDEFNPDASIDKSGKGLITNEGKARWI